LRRCDEGSVANVLGHKVGVLAQPVARTFDLDDDGVVEEAVEERSRDDVIAEDLAPFSKAPVGGTTPTIWPLP